MLVFWVLMSQNYETTLLQATRISFFTLTIDHHLNFNMATAENYVSCKYDVINGVNILKTILLTSEYVWSRRFPTLNFIHST